MLERIREQTSHSLDEWKKNRSIVQRILDSFRTVNYQQVLGSYKQWRKTGPFTDTELSGLYTLVDEGIGGLTLIELVPLFYETVMRLNTNISIAKAKISGLEHKLSTASQLEDKEHENV